MRGTRRPSAYAPVSDDVAGRRGQQSIYKAAPDYTGSKAVAAMIGVRKGSLWELRRIDWFPVKPRRKMGKRPMWVAKNVQRWIDAGEPHRCEWRKMEAAIAGCYE